jgi:NhaA family Na+:H+ antiporter
MSHDTERLSRTWIDSDRVVPSRFVKPLVQFTHIEAAGGMVLLVATVVALMWANAPFGESYEAFWETHLTFDVGGFHFDESLTHIVNDALMVIFFFVVGLEIKRELVVGELNDLKRAALPAVAALGGMVAPALIYVAFTLSTGGEAAHGWGIPMATDIAFSVGVISLLGTRVSVSAKLFLLALAIADDIGAIAVIAIFYTSDLALGWLVAAIAGLVLVYVSQRVHIRSMLYYSVLGVAIWFFVFESGVHATLAGVALGLMTPVHSYITDDEFRRRGGWILSRYEMDAASTLPRERIDANALEMADLARESVAPLDRLERRLHPWSSFVVIPLFALANAGIRFADIDVVEAATSPVALGVAAGLVVGKIGGIALATWLAVRFGIGRLPRRTGWRQILGLGALAGIGFTVSLFITELAFTDVVIADAAKIGIFVGSTVAGVVGYLLLRSSPTPQEELEASRRAMGLDEYEGYDYVDVDGRPPESTPTAGG